MFNVADHLKAGFGGLSLDEVLQLPAFALLGVTQSAADALRSTGIETIFDLGSSWLFANASSAIGTAVPGASSLPVLEVLPAGFSIGGGIAGAFEGVTGVLGFGGGKASSSQESETRTESSSSSWSIGNRSVMAEMSQHVNDRTEQHSTASWSRARAPAIRLGICTSRS
jgi:hypothetical protein